MSERQPAGERRVRADDRAEAGTGSAPVLDASIADRLKRDAAGLVPAIVQESATGEVLMVGWMDDEALQRTLDTGLATYWSRSRRRYWVKGETSGHRQRVRSVAVDCDGDALLLTVDQTGPACHTGTHSCFSEKIFVAPLADQAADEPA